MSEPHEAESNPGFPFPFIIYEIHTQVYWQLLKLYDGDITFITLLSTTMYV